MTAHALNTFEGEVCITEKKLVAEDTFLFRFVPVGNGTFPQWAPGSHVEIRLGEGLIRQYSLCSRSTDRFWEIAVLRSEAGRGGSVQLCDTLGIGDKVEIFGTRNHFGFEDSPRYLFLAGGIGITPILPMIEAAEEAGRSWELHYGARCNEALAFEDRLSQYGDRVTLYPEDRTGRIPLGELTAGLDPATLVYSCGPGPMLNAVEAAMAHLPESMLRIERFAAVEAPQPVGGDQPFKVELALSGETIEVAANESMLDALRKAGTKVDFSCMEGTCGACEVSVLRGKIDHRDAVLTKAEQRAGELVMPCVSRATGTLTLEL
ncbi:PDR/VanB family oxidoreductase [Arthrobacter sp. B6]|uniref:PDR/VanB family oxidoreductase n=1 Tax=Arthrobacter sp. B6 TaxID=1570137 RepID=UPI000836E847|nr:PDR/VanB family oxidoreductase [Arthrobacter sp. B6]